MSRDERIRNLMRRLVAMSPEPPPFPEEVTMARRQPTERPHPALVVAITVAAVAALAVPLFLFLGGGDGDPIAGTSTTSTTVAPATSTTQGSGTTTTTAATTTSQPIEVTWSGVVYLYQEPENSFVGNPALVPVILEVGGLSGEDVEFSRALSALRAGAPEGFSNAIPGDVVVTSQATEGEVITADMSEAFIEGAGGALGDFTMLNQLIYTLTHEDSDLAVLFTVNGEPVEAFGSEGLDLTEPVDRETFREELHVINLTQPITTGGYVTSAERGYLVEGIANVFEATLNVAVLDGNGEVIHEEVVTATCGTGCWGEFSTRIPAEHVVAGESSMKVFTYSAEDGSVVEAITIRIPEADLWRLDAGG